ncbi:MAG: hypothetical protein LBL07_10475 [Tannerella sp.]|jgi:hypothetical protein|nr:hypothetical protein [Tannerella sp.]
MKPIEITKRDTTKIDYMISLSNGDYNLYCTYNRIDEVQEVIRGNYCLPVSDTPAPVKVKNIDYIIFKTKDMGIIVDFVCIKRGDKFDLYEMNMNAYNEYERYMVNFDKYN